MRVNLAVTGIVHQPFMVRLVNQRVQKLFPEALIKRVAPFAIVRGRLRHVAPVRKIQKYRA